MRSAERQWWVQHQSAAERGLFAFWGLSACGTSVVQSVQVRNTSEPNRTAWANS